MAKTTEMVEVALEMLVPYERNAKKHPQEQIDKLKKSIQEFGFISPCLIDRDNRIIAGHGRVEAARQIGMNVVPCVYVEGLTDEQRRAYILADNRLTELGGWDMDVVFEELTELDDFGFNVELTGFEMPEEVSEVVEDDFDENLVSDEQRTNPGDLWQLGEHRLLCSDSTDTKAIEKLMAGHKANMVFTDPPYGYNYQSNMRTQTKRFDVLENDDKILDFFPTLIGRVEGFVMVCTTWKVLDKWLPLFGKYYKLSNMIIWDKGGGGIGDLKHTFSTDYEVILCASNGAEIRGKRIGSVWSIGKDSANDYTHPTQKPAALPAMAIRYTTATGAIVLDVFGGSGSTLIACEQLGRKCYMCEIDPHYCDVIIARWENFTGKKAVRLND